VKPIRTRKPLDVGRLGNALARAGIDPRSWVSYGTVATVGDNGEVDYTDPAAVLVTGDGVDVDVYLEPLGIPVTANYVGLQGGKKVSIFSPIKPGDRVLVVLPDGDTLGPPAIVAILHSAYDRLPLGADNLPIFQNDRLLIHSDG